MNDERLKLVMLRAKCPSVKLAAQDIANEVTREQAQEIHGRTVARVNNRTVVENLVAGDLVHQGATYVRRTSREMHLAELDPGLRDLEGLLRALVRMTKDTPEDCFSGPGVYVMTFDHLPETHVKVGKTKDLLRRINAHRTNGVELKLHAFFRPQGETHHELEDWAHAPMKRYRRPGKDREIFLVRPERAVEYISDRAEQVFP